MKYYRVEPKMKKSVVEIEYFARPDGVRLSVEVGWRWGEYVLKAPETEEEWQEWFDTRWDIPKEEYDEDPDLWPTLPNPEEDDVLELEDWDHEMLSTWDGCWEDYNVYAGYGATVELTEEMKDEIIDILQEEGSTALWEDWPEDHPLYGFETQDCTAVIYNGFTMVECDEHGNVLEDEE